jgi:hypothetical protein
MPEVIVIDEIGTELEAVAARTIAERGVQLVGTAHGNTLENLMMNPTLADLIGGIQSVTLGDEEAKRRGTQKSILERKSPPTFDIVVEIQDRDRVAIHPDVATAVDASLRGEAVDTEVRWLDENGEVKTAHKKPAPVTTTPTEPAARPTTRQDKQIRMFLYGVNRGRLEQTAKEMQVNPVITDDLRDANLFVTSKQYYRRRPSKVREAEETNIPLYVLKGNSPPQIRQLLSSIYPPNRSLEPGSMRSALGEADAAVNQVEKGQDVVELSPQSAYIRRLQHMIAERHNLGSESVGKEPHRRVTIFRGER